MKMYKMSNGKMMKNSDMKKPMKPMMKKPVSAHKSGRKR